MEQTVSKCAQLAYALEKPDHVTTEDIYSLVLSLFSIDLAAISELDDRWELTLPPVFSKRNGLQTADYTTHSRHELFQLFLTGHPKPSALEIQEMILLLFNVNLAGLEAIEQGRISLFSKNQWVLKKPDDLFVVYTGKGDIDVKVYSTPFYREKTGTTHLPEEAEKQLRTLGYKVRQEPYHLYFENVSPVPVEDAFKGRTLGILLEAARSFKPSRH